jgi:hypothetical protein
MTRREHSRALAEGRIEKLNALRNALIDTAHAIFDVLAYDDQHILDCKHQGPSLEDLEDAQRDKETTEQQLAALRGAVAGLPSDQAELHRSIFILPLEDRLRLIDEDISRIQEELEEKESEVQQ